MSAPRHVLAFVGAVVALAVPTSAAASGRSPEALRLLSDIVHGRESAVASLFDAQMRAQLSIAGLRTAWASYQRTFGAYISHGAPTVTPLDGDTVVRIPLKMTSRDGELRVTFNPQGLIAGLYFLRTGVPL